MSLLAQTQVGRSWQWRPGQILRHLAEPRSAYLADWDDLPEWQRETDADIFEHVERIERSR